MHNKTCENCKKDYQKDYQTIKVKKRFCSRDCYNKYNRGTNHPRYSSGLSAGSKTTCLNCNKLFTRNTHNQKYCNQSCQLKYEYKNGIRDKREIVRKAHETVINKSLKRFNTNPNTYIDKRGYKQIYIPLRGWKKYHHYVWENSGRVLLDGYCLHHINGNKLDNRLKNLIMITHKDHAKIHDMERERDENGRYV